MTAVDVGSRARTTLSVALLGTPHELTVIILFFQVTRRERGSLYIYTPILLVFPHILLPIPGALISWHNMLKVRVGKKGLSPPQKCHVLVRLITVMYGHRKHKFRRVLHLDRGGTASFLLLVKIRSRFCSCQRSGMSEERFSAIIASA